MSERGLFIFLVGYVVGRVIGVVDTLIKEYIDKHVGVKTNEKRFNRISNISYIIPDNS